MNTEVDFKGREVRGTDSVAKRIQLCMKKAQCAFATHPCPSRWPASSGSLYVVGVSIVPASGDRR